MILKYKLKLLILLLIGIYLPSILTLNENDNVSKKTITITTLKKKDNLNKRSNDDTTSNETSTSITISTDTTETSTITSTSDTEETTTSTSDIWETTTSTSDTEETTTSNSDIWETTTSTSDIWETTTSISDVSETSTITFTETETYECYSFMETDIWDYDTWDTQDYTIWDYTTESYEDETETTDYEEATEIPGSNNIQRKTCKFLKETHVDTEMKQYKSELLKFYFDYFKILLLKQEIIKTYKDIKKEFHEVEMNCMDEITNVDSYLINQNIKYFKSITKIMKKAIYDFHIKYEKRIKDYLDFLNELLENWNNNNCDLYFASSTKKIEDEIGSCENKEIKIAEFYELYEQIEESELNIEKIEEIISNKKMCIMYCKYNR